MKREKNRKTLLWLIDSWLIRFMNKLISAHSLLIYFTQAVYWSDVSLIKKMEGEKGGGGGKWSDAGGFNHVRAAKLSALSVKKCYFHCQNFSYPMNHWVLIKL